MHGASGPAAGTSPCLTAYHCTQPAPLHPHNPHSRAQTCCRLCLVDRLTHRWPLYTGVKFHSLQCVTHQPHCTQMATLHRCQVSLTSVCDIPTALHNCPVSKGTTGERGTVGCGDSWVHPVSVVAGIS